MAAPRALGQQELNDILNGACMLGAGGGGPLQIGQELLQAILEMGKPVLVEDPADVPDEARMAVVAVEGSPAGAEANGPFPWDIAVTAVTQLGELLKQDFQYLLPVELGAGNSFIPLIAAARLGLPVVDASGAPRAVPTLDMLTYADAPIGPIVMADDRQSVVVEVAAADGAGAAEVATREIVGSGVFPGFAGIALWSMTGAEMKRVSLTNTLSAAQRLGAALREARGRGTDPVAAALRELAGRRLFVGEGLTAESRTVGGFDLLTIQLSSPGGADTFTIHAQNENLIAWDGAQYRPAAMIPDLICYLTTDGQPFSNADLDLARGKRVAVIGAPAGARFRTPSVMAAAKALLAGIGYAGRNASIDDLWDHTRSREAPHAQHP